MPRHRSLKLEKFIDSVPDHLLKEYFKRTIGDELKLSSFDYESVNGYLDAIQDEELKRQILEEFTHINDICEKNMNILIKALQRDGIEYGEEEKREELAMRIYLYHRDAYDYAYDYYCLFNSTSKMCHHNIAAGDFTITPEKINRFKERISEFYLNLAKGRECIIRHYDEADQTVIVIIRGSYNRSLVVWENQDTKTLFFRPANEDILHFNKKASVLSIKAPYQRDKDNYIEAFTKSILEDESQAERLDRVATYTLKPLQDGTFNFAGNEFIDSIIGVKLSMRGMTNPVLEITSSDVLKTLREDLEGLSLRSGDLVHAKFRFRLSGSKRGRNVTFEITPPNVTDLTRKRHADIIGAYLKENGVKLV